MSAPLLPTPSGGADAAGAGLLAAATRAAAEWEPDPDKLNFTVGLLQSYSTATNEEHRAIADHVEESNKDPEFSRYVAYAFRRGHDLGEQVRMLAGLWLKRNVVGRWSEMPGDVHVFIMQELLDPLRDPSRHIRRTAVNVVAHIVTQLSLQYYPALIESIVEGMQAYEASIRDEASAAAAEPLVHGSLTVLKEILSDSADEMDSDALGRPLDIIVPQLLLFLRHPDHRYRGLALDVLGRMLYNPPAVFVTAMETYVAALFELATTDGEVAANIAKVCTSLKNMCDMEMAYLVPQLDSVLEFFLAACAHSDEEVRKAAVEFWPSWTDAVEPNPALRGALEPKLDRLLEVLLTCMLYDEEELADLPVDDIADGVEPDRPEDVMPRISRASRQEATGPTGGGAAGGGGGGDGDDDEDGGGGGEEDDDGDDEVAQWTLRRRACISLDALAKRYDTALLPIIMPMIQARMTAEGDSMEAWMGREVGVLALGCITPGCLRGMHAAMGEIFPFLVGLLKDSRPLVRSITCWALSKLVHWVCAHLNIKKDPTEFLEPMLQALCASMGDHCKHVQSGACTALSYLIEAGGQYGPATMAPYAQPILETVNACFAHYQAKNSLLLYDAIGTLADSVKEHLQDERLTSLALGPVVLRWNATDDEDWMMFPLFECMQSIVAALREGFVPYATGVLSRCIKIVENTLITAAAAAEAGDSYGPDRRAAVYSLDMMGGLNESLGDSAIGLFTDAAYMSDGHSVVVRLVVECMKDAETSMRQSACAVVGDMAREVTWPLLTTEGTLDAVLTLLAQNMVVDESLEGMEREDDPLAQVASNAIWALGVCVMSLGEDVLPYLDGFLERMVRLLRIRDLENSLLMNIAVTLGRLSLVVPAAMAPHVPGFFDDWMNSLATTEEGEEKEQALRGMVAVIYQDPAAVASHFRAIAEVVSSCDEPSDELTVTLTELLAMFHESFGAAWPDQLRRISAATREDLIRRFGVTM